MSKSIKLIFKSGGASEQEMVRLSFSEPITLEAIKAAASSQWPSLGAAPTGLLFSYNDDADELCVLSSEAGFSEALLHHAGPTLKIYITQKPHAGE